jgi:hypothetical protein
LQPFKTRTWLALSRQDSSVKKGLLGLWRNGDKIIGDMNETSIITKLPLLCIRQSPLSSIVALQMIFIKRQEKRESEDLLCFVEGYFLLLRIITAMAMAIMITILPMMRSRSWIR